MDFTIDDNEEEEYYDVRLVKFYNGDDSYCATKRVYYDENSYPARIERSDPEDIVFNLCYDHPLEADYFGWEDKPEPSYTTRTEFS